MRLQVSKRPKTSPRYRRARSAPRLGGTASPILYRTAGAKFAFDVETVGAAVSLTEQVISELESNL
ncbi:MAG: hypothetical protein H6636_01130 [Anaerolineales bacterium]|nr:hypothetical protein [Anaerolineales bacterium]